MFRNLLVLKWNCVFCLSGFCLTLDYLVVGTKWRAACILSFKLAQTLVLVLAGSEAAGRKLALPATWCTLLPPVTVLSQSVAFVRLQFTYLSEWTISLLCLQVCTNLYSCKAVTNAESKYNLKDLELCAYYISLNHTKNAVRKHIGMSFFTYTSFKLWYVKQPHQTIFPGRNNKFFKLETIRYEAKEIKLPYSTWIWCDKITENIREKYILTTYLQNVSIDINLSLLLPRQFFSPHFFYSL